MTLPDRSQLSRITFVRGAGNPSLMTFAHPALTRAVRTPLESGSPPAGHDAFDLLTLEGTPKDHPGARAELHAWASDATAIAATLPGAQIVWRPGLASILAAQDRMEPLLLALVEFAFFEGELRKLEVEIDAAWPELETDTTLAYDVTAKDLERGAEIGARVERMLQRRIRFARIETPLLQTRPSLGSMAQDLGERLRDKARIESRMETLDGHLEVFEHVYEMGSQRIGETRASRKEQKLEWLIIILLAAEVLMLLLDLLWTLEV